MNFTELSFSKIKTQIENFLQQQYAKADILYSPSSPYGQILLVVENLFQLSMLYLKNTIKQFDLGDPNSLNERIIRNAAIYVGHIPSRNISSTGTLLLTIRTNTDIESSIPGSRMTFTNRQGIKNKTNNLDYSINLGSDTQTYKITTSSQIFIPIIQGTWKSKTFTGTGTLNQTFQVNLRSTQQDVENFNFSITVNGNFFSVKKHIYDMMPNEMACVVRTGFNGGIDIIFGNGGFGYIPEISSIIQINYLVSDGSIGSIFRRTLNDWTFVDPILDGYGNSLDITNLFDIAIYTDINFGADRENIQFTKNILPIASNNFVLGTPQQYAYQIKRLGVFSHVNAYEDSGMVYIVATPNIQLFQNSNSNYFSINISAFTLDDYEKSKIDMYLKAGGNILLTRKYQIVSPILSYYVMNIFIVTWSDAIDQNVNSQIINIISKYFLDLNKMNRIPKSDLIALISDNITDICSLEISFISKKNEDYQRQAILDDSNKRNQYASQTNFKIIKASNNYNPNYKIGIDPVVGDILFEPNEIPIIRGGFYDRNNIYYSDDINSSGLKSVNIIKTGTVDVRNKNQV